MNENRRMFIKDLALAEECVFASLSPTKLFGEEKRKRIAAIERPNGGSLKFYP